MRCMNRNLRLCRKADLHTVMDDRCVNPSAHISIWQYFKSKQFLQALRASFEYLNKYQIDLQLMKI